MIYFISGQTKLFEAGICTATFQNILDYFRDHLEIEIDSETMGFDPHTDKLLTLQLGDANNQFVMEESVIDWVAINELLKDKLCLFQNAKFDLKFLYHKGVFPNKIYDTFLGECVLTTGIEERELGLDALALKYLSVVLDKSIRGNIHKEGLTDRVIKYAADDVAYLGGIKYKQLQLIEKFDLKRTLDLENEFVKCLAYAEYCGFKLDKEKWLKNDLENKKLLKTHENLLSDWIVKNNVKGISKQYGLFGEEIAVSINWSSSKQVVELFKQLGVNCILEKKGESKETVDIKHIEKQKHISTIIPIYLEYKKVEKQISTYGLKFANFINPVTGRIHTNFFQIINTGRLSSSKPNLQNITSTEGVRSCFVAEKGNMLTINDFSSQEPRALAGLSKDSKLIDFFYNGDGDIHSFVASKLYTIINGKDTVITKSDKFERQVGKILNLKLNYGGAAYTVKDDLGKSEEEAQVFITALEKAFPEKEIYFKNKIKETFTNGYITTNPLTRRKIFLPAIKEFMELDTQLKLLKGRTNNIPKSFWKKYYTLRGTIERSSKNYPIQGSAADQTKIAGIYFYNWIISNNLWGIVKICSFIHDEIVVEAPEDIIEKVGKKLQECMEKAGRNVVPNMEFPAEPFIYKYWKKG